MFEFDHVDVLHFNFINSATLRLVGRTLYVNESIEGYNEDDERLKGVSGLACCVAYCSSLVYLGLLLGFVENLTPFCLGGMNRFIYSGKLLKELKVAIVKFVYL
jgi:hypothetical protein